MTSPIFAILHSNKNTFKEDLMHETNRYTSGYILCWLLFHYSRTFLLFPPWEWNVEFCRRRCCLCIRCLKLLPVRTYLTRLRQSPQAWKAEQISFDGIYTGYLASAEQCEQICDFFDQFATGENLVLVDPAMADNGKLYPAFDENFPATMAKVMCESGRDTAEYYRGRSSYRYALSNGLW